MNLRVSGFLNMCSVPGCSKGFSPTGMPKNPKSHDLSASEKVCLVGRGLGHRSAGHLVNVPHSSPTSHNLVGNQVCPSGKHRPSESGAKAPIQYLGYRVRVPKCMAANCLACSKTCYCSRTLFLYLLNKG